MLLHFILCVRALFVSSPRGRFRCPFEKERDRHRDMWGVTKQEKVEGQWNATVRGIVVAVGGDDSGGSVDGETDGGGACGGNRGV